MNQKKMIDSNTQTISAMMHKINVNLFDIADTLDTVSQREERMNNRLLLLRAKQSLNLTMEYINSIERSNGDN